MPASGHWIAQWQVYHFDSTNNYILKPGAVLSLSAFFFSFLNWAPETVNIYNLFLLQISEASVKRLINCKVSSCFCLIFPSYTVYYLKNSQSWTEVSAAVCTGPLIHNRGIIFIPCS